MIAEIHAFQTGASDVFAALCMRARKDPAQACDESLADTPRVPQPKLRAGTDTAVLSTPTKLLSQAGLDPSRTELIGQSNLTYFRFAFEDQRLTNLCANGFYDARTQHLVFDFSFCANLYTVHANGKFHSETFQIDLHCEVFKTERYWENRSVCKEDVRQFALEILRDIAKLHAEGKEIDGLRLTDEDARDLASMDGGEFIRFVIQLVNLIKVVNHLRHQDKDHVILAPERDKSLVTDIGFESQEGFKFSLEIHKVSDPKSHS